MILLKRLTMALLAATPCVASADTIIMHNGDRLSGEIVDLDGSKLQIKGPYADRISVAWDQVRSIRSDAPLYATAADGSEIQGTLSTNELGELVLETDGPLGALALAPDAVVGLRRTPRPAVSLSGFVNIGASATSGNTETRAAHVDGELVARTTRNRYVLAADADYEEDDGETTVNEAAASATYDHFLTSRWYLNSNLAVERDEFADLELRTTVGAGLGYQFADNGTKASAELGLSYVREDYEMAEDEGNPAARWALRYERPLWTRLTFFHRQEVLLNLQDAEDSLLRTRTGLRAPLVANVNGAIQLDYDYDNAPPPGAEHSDSTVLLTLGYTF